MYAKQNPVEYSSSGVLQPLNVDSNKRICIIKQKCKQIFYYHKALMSWNF